MKKMILTALMSLVSIGALNAAQYSGCATDCYSPRNTYASSCCSFLDGVNLDVDFLWWQTAADNLFAEVEVTDTSVSPQPASLTNYYSNYQWKPGYRIALGYEGCFCGCNVELFAKWTWYRSSASRNLDFALVADQNVSIFDPFGTAFTIEDSPGAVLFYRNSTSFLYERLDLGFVSATYQLGCFEVKPSVAVTGVYIKDSFNAFTASDTPEISQLFTGSGKFSGAGITLGAEINYAVVQNFSLYSVSEVTGAWGRIRQSANGVLLDATDVDELLSVTGNYWAGRLILGQEFGVEYSACVCSFPVNVHLGWQFLYMPNMAMATFAGVQDRTVNGLIAGFAVGF